MSFLNSVVVVSFSKVTLFIFSFNFFSLSLNAFLLLISLSSLLKLFHRIVPLNSPDWLKIDSVLISSSHLIFYFLYTFSGLKDLIKALLDLLKNKTYVFSSLALTIKITFAVALGGFFTKVVMLKFGGTLSDIALFSAAVYIPGNVSKYL